MTTPNTPSPGWYPDASAQGQVRYWDGAKWTEHTAPAQAPVTPVTPVTPTQSGFASWVANHKVLTGVVAAVAALMIIGGIGAAVGDTNSTAYDTADTSPNVTGSTTPEPTPSSEAEKPSTTEASTEPKASESSTPAPDPTPLSVQDRFIAIVDQGHDAADDADNEIVVVQARKARGQAICKLLPALRVKNWTGTVEDVSTVLGGDSGVLSIAITDDYAVQTWNNSLSDIGSRTLIKPSSAVYGQLAVLSEDDDVTFSGHFVSDSGSCIQEQSLMDENGLLTPDFSFVFTMVKKS